MAKEERAVIQHNMIIRRAAPVFCSSCRRRFGGSRPGTDDRSVEVPVEKGIGRDG